jgi:hypothetical protein
MTHGRRLRGWVYRGDPRRGPSRCRVPTATLKGLGGSEWIGVDGSEAVVLGNCATTAQSVHGWQLVHRNGRTTKLDADIPACAAP